MTSFAKTLEDQAYHQSKIDQAKRLGVTFNSETTKASEQNNSQSSKQGSSMVEKDKPAANLRPPENIARPVDRNKFEKDWSKEEKKADNYQDRLAERAERLKSQETPQNDNDKNSHGLSHS